MDLDISIGYCGITMAIKPWTNVMFVKGFNQEYKAQRYDKQASNKFCNVFI